MKPPPQKPITIGGTPDQLQKLRDSITRMREELNRLDHEVEQLTRTGGIQRIEFQG